MFWQHALPGCDLSTGRYGYVFQLFHCTFEYGQTNCLPTGLVILSECKEFPGKAALAGQISWIVLRTHPQDPSSFPTVRMKGFWCEHGLQLFAYGNDLEHIPGMISA